MSEFKLVVCDGCDSERKIAAGEIDDFYHIRTTAGAWGKYVDLCPNCHDNLLGRIDPCEWPREA